MLRYGPTRITLEMDDVDLAVHRMKLQAAIAATHRARPELVRVRRGPRRFVEEALTHSSLSMERGDVGKQEDAQQRRAPRYRKDLTKLGLPSSYGNGGSSSEHYHAAAGMLDGTYETDHSHGGVRLDAGQQTSGPISPWPLLPPPTIPQSSTSTPNLGLHVAPMDGVHRRSVSATVSSSDLPPPIALRASDILASRLTSEPCEPPLLEILSHYASPLEDLERKLESLSSSSSSKSNSLRSSKRSRRREHNTLRFPSFESPERHALGSSAFHGHRSMSPFPDREASLRGGHESARSPYHTKAIKATSRQGYNETDGSFEAPQRPTRLMHIPEELASSCKRPASRRDSAIEFTSDHSSPHGDGFETSSANAETPRPRHSSHTRSMPAPQSLSVKGQGSPREQNDIHRSHRDLPFRPARHSMPTSPYAELRIPSANIQVLERHRSHGYRPSQPPQRYTHPMALQRPRLPDASRNVFSDRLPPQPTVAAAAQTPLRSGPVRQRDQENNGSAEEEMMMEELRLLHLRDAGPVVQQHRGTAMAPGADAGVLDDTPPGEGRFERLMRS